MKQIEFEMVIEGGRARVAPDHKQRFDNYISQFKDEEKIFFKSIDEKEYDYQKWRGWYFGILIPIVMEHSELDGITIQDRSQALEVYSDYMKELYCDVRDSSLIKEYVSSTGKPRYRLFSLSNGGISYKKRMEFSLFVQMMLSTKTGLDYDVLEREYRKENNIPPKENKYVIGEHDEERRKSR